MRPSGAITAILLICLAILSGGGGAMADSLEESLRRLHSRAESGDSRALYDLASLYENGYDTIMADRERAVRLYHESAERGFAPAQNYLGFMYYRGDGVRQDLDSAIIWIQKAATQGDPKGANNLGWLLTEGRGVKHDFAKAAEWYAKAADAGLPAAMSQLADLYRLGLGVAPDTLKAERLYRDAAAKGLSDAEDKMLAMMHPLYQNMPTDTLIHKGLDYYTHRAPKAGVVLFEIAADRESPKAMALLGDAYTHGRGVAYDHDKALDFYYRAAKWGDPSAQYIIGELIEIFPDALKDMRGLEPDDNIPAYWYDRAAAQGVTTAQSAQSRLLQP